MSFLWNSPLFQASLNYCVSLKVNISSSYEHQKNFDLLLLYHLYLGGKFSLRSWNIYEVMWILSVSFSSGPTRMVLMGLLELVISKEKGVWGPEGTQPNFRPASGFSWEPASWQKQGGGTSSVLPLLIEDTAGWGCREQGGKVGLGGGLPKC